MEFGPAELVQGQLFSRTPVLDSIRNEELGKNSIDEATAGTTSGIQPDQPASVIKRFVLWSDRRSEFCGLAGPTCRCHQTVDFPARNFCLKNPVVFLESTKTDELMRPRRCAFAKKQRVAQKIKRLPKKSVHSVVLPIGWRPVPKTIAGIQQPLFWKRRLPAENSLGHYKCHTQLVTFALYVNGPSNNPRLRFNPSFQRLIIGWHVRIMRSHVVKDAGAQVGFQVRNAKNKQNPYKN